MSLQALKIIGSAASRPSHRIPGSTHTALDLQHGPTMHISKFLLMSLIGSGLLATSPGALAKPGEKDRKGKPTQAEKGGKGGKGAKGNKGKQGGKPDKGNKGGNKEDKGNRGKDKGPRNIDKDRDKGNSKADRGNRGTDEIDRSNRRKVSKDVERYRFRDNERDALLSVFQLDDGRRDLPPGLAKNLRRGKPLPPGWQDKIYDGYIVEDDGFWDHFVPVDYDYFPNVERYDDVRLYAYGDRIVRVYEPRREIIDIVVVEALTSFLGY